MLKPAFWLYTFILIFLTACGNNAASLPTADAENNIFITATSPLPTPNADGIVLITATPDMVATQQANAQPAFNPTAIDTNVQPTEIPVQSVDAQANTSVNVSAQSVDTSAQLAEANRLLRDGYFEEAVTAYQQIVQIATDPAVRGEASYNLGQAALREGFFDAAVDALTLVIEELPNSENYARAHFLRGDAYLGLSQWNSAITDFQTYISLRPGLIDSYAYERIGDAHFALGQTDLALSAYNNALQAQRTLVPQLILQERVAQIYTSVGQVDAAVAIYDDILAVARNTGYRATIELNAAQSYDSAGRADDAVERATRVVQNYTETTAAYDALQILLANDVNVDAYRRGLINFTYGEYPAAIDAFNTFTTENTLDTVPARLYLLLGRSYRELGNWEAARLAFQTIIEQYPNDTLFGTALLERGRTYFLQDDIPQAITTYVAVADNYAYLTEIAAEALWRAGYLYSVRLNDTASSRATFTRIANDYSTSEWALSGLQIAASNAIANGETAVAEGFYNRIAEITTGEDRAIALYWVGRFALERGDQASAENAFSQASAASATSFYALRANDILIGREAFVPPVNVNFTFDEEAERQQAEEWLRSVFNFEQTSDLYILSSTLENDPRLIRGRELWAVGAYADARNEFDSLLDEARANSDVLTSYQLAHFLRDIGDFYSSIFAAADVINATGLLTLDVPPYLGRMRYPAYYSGLVQEQANAYGFDPLLMLSLMRQESFFNPTATSVADALGLTQVIPSTASYIADELNYVNFEVRDLYRPHVSVAFGAFYLDEQLRLFGGNKAAALAAYNAGPGFTLDWVRLSGGDIDSLVATITFAETKLYVERIYSHYTIYRELYGTP